MEIEVSEKEKRRSDPYIWGIIIILYIVSVVEVYSAISREITGGDVYSPIIKHIMLLFSGFVITYVTSQIHYKWFKVLAYLMIPLTIVLLVSILFWGDNVRFRYWEYPYRARKSPKLRLCWLWRPFWRRPR